MLHILLEQKIPYCIARVLRPQEQRKLKGKQRIIISYYFINHCSKIKGTETTIKKKKVTNYMWQYLIACIEFISHSMKLRNSVPLEWQLWCLRNFKSILEPVAFLWLENNASVPTKMRWEKRRRKGKVKRQSDLKIAKRKETAQELFHYCQNYFPESTESFLPASNCIFK